jgi:two-component system, OmpR family, phosphate regulon sensor histidine kinase PhoR
MSSDRSRVLPRLPLLGRNAAAEQLVRERTGMLEQRVNELEAQVTDLARILRGMGEGVLAVDRAGILVHANPAATELLELDPDRSLGHHMFIAVPHPVACDLIEDVMRGESRLVRELVVDRAEGELVLVLSCRPLRKAGVEDGEPEGAIMVVRDVTDLRRLERSRQDFFGNVSHELKTPVTAIRGALETILDDPAMSEEVRARFLDSARRHSLRLSALVTDLLALARLEGDPGALQRSDVDLWNLVGEVFAASESGAQRRDIELELVAATDHGDTTFTVHADEEAVRQAVSNLVDNAIAHSADGGRVRTVLAHRDSHVELRVEDEGTGIPPDALERVFERFYRVDAARSRERGGTGIGLSIVKHVAQAHGGTVSVTSELGAGSTFTLQLPVSPPPMRGTPKP